MFLLDRFIEYSHSVQSTVLIIRGVPKAILWVMHPQLEDPLDKTTRRRVAVWIPRKPLSTIKSFRHVALTFPATHEDVQQSFHSTLPQVFLVQ